MKSSGRASSLSLRTAEIIYLASSVEQMETYNAQKIVLMCRNVILCLCLNLRIHGNSIISWYNGIKLMHPYHNTMISLDNKGRVSECNIVSNRVIMMGRQNLSYCFHFPPWKLALSLQWSFFILKAFHFQVFWCNVQMHHGTVTHLFSKTILKFEIKNALSNSVQATTQVFCIWPLSILYHGLFTVNNNNKTIVWLLVWSWCQKRCWLSWYKICLLSQFHSREINVTTNTLQVDWLSMLFVDLSSKRTDWTGRFSCWIHDGNGPSQILSCSVAAQGDDTVCTEHIYRYKIYVWRFPLVCTFSCFSQW